MMYVVFVFSFYTWRNQGIKSLDKLSKVTQLVNWIVWIQTQAGLASESAPVSYGTSLNKMTLSEEIFLHRCIGLLGEIEFYTSNIQWQPNQRKLWR